MVTAPEVFTFTVPAASWTAVQSYVQSLGPDGVYSSGEDFLRAFLCEDFPKGHSQFEGSLPTEVGSASSGVEFQVSLTASQVATADSALKQNDCSVTEGVTTVQQDYTQNNTASSISSALHAAKSNQ